MDGAGAGAADAFAGAGAGDAFDGAGAGDALFCDAGAGAGDALFCGDGAGALPPPPLAGAAAGAWGLGCGAAPPPPPPAAGAAAAGLAGDLDGGGALLSLLLAGGVVGGGLDGGLSPLGAAAVTGLDPTRLSMMLACSSDRSAEAATTKASAVTTARRGIGTDGVGAGLVLSGVSKSEWVN